MVGSEVSKSWIIPRGKKNQPFLDSFSQTTVASQRKCAISGHLFFLLRSRLESMPSRKKARLLHVIGHLFAHRTGTRLENWMFSDDYDNEK